MDLVDVRVRCPYCNERIDLQIDPSIKSQSYEEDCSVCCRPIVLTIELEDEMPRVRAGTIDE